MKILFLINSKFAGDALSSGPLGGTETALIGTSRELAKNPDNQVFVCANTPERQTWDDVDYLPLDQLGAWASQNTVDVFISVRSWLPLWFPLRARARIYFSPDAYDQPSLLSAASAQIRIDGQTLQVPVLKPAEFFSSINRVFCVGRWQAGTFDEELGFPREKLLITGNAIFPENFRPLPLQQRQNSIVYSATPFRGLEYMVDYFQQLKTEYPDLLFEVCSGLGVYGRSAKEDQTQFGQLYDGLSLGGATLHGPVDQRTLAEIMCRSRLYTYPNTFAETFCISVLEAQAAGLPVITSDLGAMPERITHGVDGFLISGSPSEGEYRRSFIELSEQLLTDDNLWLTISNAAIKTAAGQTYANVAAQWVEVFKDILRQNSEATAPAPPKMAARKVSIPGHSGRQLDLPGEYIDQYIKGEFANFGFSA